MRRLQRLSLMLIAFLMVAGCAVAQWTSTPLQWLPDEVRLTAIAGSRVVTATPGGVLYGVPGGPITTVSVPYGAFTTVAVGSTIFLDSVPGTLYATDAYIYDDLVVVDDGSVGGEFDVVGALTAGTVASDASISATTHVTAATYLAGLTVRTRTLEDHDGTDYLTAVGTAVALPGTLGVTGDTTLADVAANAGSFSTYARAPYFRPYTSSANLNLDVEDNSYAVKIRNATDVEQWSCDSSGNTTRAGYTARHGGAGYTFLMQDSGVPDADSGWHDDNDKTFTYHIDGVPIFSVSPTDFTAAKMILAHGGVLSYATITVDYNGDGAQGIYYGSGEAGNQTWKLMSDNTSGTYDRVSLWLPASPASGASVEIVEYATDTVRFKKPIDVTGTGTFDGLASDGDAFLDGIVRVYNTQYLDYAGDGSQAKHYYAGERGSDQMYIGAAVDGSARYCEIDFVFAADPGTAPGVVGMTVTSAGIDVAKISQAGTAAITLSGNAVTMPGALGVTGILTAGTLDADGHCEATTYFKGPYYRGESSQDTNIRISTAGQAVNVQDVGGVSATSTTTGGNQDGRWVTQTWTRHHTGGTPDTGFIRYGGSDGLTDGFDTDVGWTFGAGLAQSSIVSKDHTHSAYAVLSTNLHILTDASAGNLSITLPAATGSGRILEFTATVAAGGAFDVTLDAATHGALINGAGTNTTLIDAQWDFGRIKDIATNVWSIQ